MYETVEENSQQRKTDEKPIFKNLSGSMLFLIPTVLVILLFGAIMGAIAGFTSTPALEDGAVKLEAMAAGDRQTTQFKKNEPPSPGAKLKKSDPEEEKELQKVVLAKSGKVKDEIIFKVQVISSKRPVGPNSPRFKGLKNVWEYQDGGLYKYTLGNKNDLRSASELQSELRKNGFGDAFVVAFKNGKRIPVREAL